MSEIGANTANTVYFAEAACTSCDADAKSFSIKCGQARPFQIAGHRMSMFDAEDATIAELSEELIFLIAAVSTDAQRKHAIELFRHFARQIEAEAYLRGQQSIASKATLSPTIAMLPAPGSIDSAPQHERISLIPPVNWQD